MLKIFCLIVISVVIGVFTLNVTKMGIFFALLSLPILCFIFRNYSLYENLAKYIMFAGIYISVIFIPAFRLGYTQTTPQQYAQVFSFGAILLLMATIFWLFVSILVKEKQHVNIAYGHRKISTIWVVLFLLLSIALSIFSFSIGLGKMGAEAVRLPFHLGGIIMMLRMFLIPYLFMIIYENYILTKRKFSNIFFLIFFIWCLIEVFARLSKGALIFNFLPVAIIHWIYFRPSIKKMLSYLSPILLLFFFLYPIIQNMRYIDNKDSITESFLEAEIESKESSEDGNVFIKSLNRTFMTTSHYTKDYFLFTNELLFDFSRAPVIMEIGGVGRYQTLIIDGYNENAVHSSGSTGIMDPLLFGGYGFCYVMIFLMMWIAEAIDRSFYREMHSVYVILILLFQTFILNQNISYLFAENGLPYLLARVVAIYLAIQLNFKSKLVLH